MKKAKSKTRMAVLFFLLWTITGLLFFTLFLWPRPLNIESKHQDQGNYRRPQARTDAASGDAQKSPDALPKQGGKIALIIDDAGGDLEKLDRYLRFPGKLSIAVLPALTHSTETAKRVHAAGREVLLHLPMEPLGSENPGPGAVLVSFDRKKIRGLLESDFQSVPFAQGANNHMGSLATQDRAVMDAVFSYLKESGRYFVDSRTVAATLGGEYATLHGVPFIERDVFLDINSDRASIERALGEGVARARLKGGAVIIGHIQNETVLEVISEQYDELTAAGIEFVTVTELMRERGADRIENLGD